LDRKRRWFPWPPKKREDQEIEDLRKRIAERPDDPRLHQRLAELLLEKGRRPEALEAFVKAAQCHADAGFHLRAIAMYRRVLRMEESPEILLKLAELYLSNGLLGDALVQYRKVIHLYKNQGKSHEILGLLRRMAEVAPDNLEVRVKYIELLRKEGFPDQAFDELLRLYLVYREGPDKSFSRQLEEQIHDLARELEELFLAQGRQRELVLLKQKMEGLATIQPQHGPAPCAAPGDLPEQPAQEEEMEILEIEGESGEDLGAQPAAGPEEGRIPAEEISARLEEARVYEEQGLLDEAEQIYTELLAIDPQFQEARESLARIGQEREKLGRPKAGGDLKKLEEVEEKQRRLSETRLQKEQGLQDAKAHYELGLSFKELGLLDEAISELEIASSHPQLAFACYRELGGCHRAKGNLTEAVGFLRKALQCKGVGKGQFLEAGYELAQTLEQLGKRKEALALYTKIQEQDQGFRDIEERVKILSQ